MGACRMIVVEAFVLVNLLLCADERGERARDLLVRDRQWTAPEHWKAEVFSVARGLTLGHKVHVEQAAWAVQQIPALGVDTVSVRSPAPPSPAPRPGPAARAGRLSTHVVRAVRTSTTRLT